MRIGITGSWKEEDREFWALRPNLHTFKVACRQLGEEIARSSAEITVGTDSASTADRYVVEGYLSNPREGLSVRIVRPQRGAAPFTDLYASHPGAFVYLPGSAGSWRHTRQQFIFDIDVLVTIGGGDGTYQAGLEVGLTKKRLVPIGTFGGASSRLLSNFLNSRALRQPDLFEKLGNPWTADLACHVVALVGASQPSKVLLIHGHSHDHIELQAWLRNEKLADPVVMAQEFTSGQTLPEKFEFLAGETDAAIALATPDDLATTTAVQTDLKKARARQNVSVEVGWFWGRLGRHRMLLLTRGDIEIPSDLDGIEYHNYKQSPVELENLVRRFLLSVNGRNSSMA